MADGALRNDVLKVLGQNEVEVTTLPENRYRLAKAEVLFTVRMLDTVSRTVLAMFERHFGISKSKFFPAATNLKVVPITSGKAAGEQEPKQ